MAIRALLNLCDAVLACRGISDATRAEWAALRNKAQPAFADIFGDMFSKR